MKKKHLLQSDLFCSKGITLSDKTDLSQMTEAFSMEEKKQFVLVYDLIETEPLKAFDLLEILYQKHPQFPLIGNLLTFVLLKLKKLKEADALTEEIFQRHPDYLIARINYADLLQRQKKWEQIPALFLKTFDLSLLYPKRKTFHFAECRGYFVMLGFYMEAMGKEKEAKECYRLAVLSDPHHTSVLSLEKKLFHNITSRKAKQQLRKLLNFLKEKFSRKSITS